ncbi:MAG: thiamine pyrophosphate-dependent enzyme [Anaerolineae bacterium]|nr:thiamine pyrophosphate-dependent enzyme [Anaerolineae bacterium]
MPNKKPSIEVNWLETVRTILTSRYIDEIEENKFAPQGRLPYQFSAKGHELAQVLLAQQLTHQHDGACVYYRSRPFVLASGLSTHEALAAGFAKTGSPSEGRDGGVIYSMQARNGATILPASGSVGSQFSQAAGWAQAIHYRHKVLGEKDWGGAISVALGGEGAVAANGFWAALNIVTTRNLPYLFFIEDNGFAISVRSELQTPGGNIAANLASYSNLKIIEADGTDPVEAAEKIAKAVAHVRMGSPCLLRMDVVRIMGHTFLDDQSYKSAEERKLEAKRDPLKSLKKYLPDLDWKTLEREVKAEVHEAAEKALQNLDPEPATTTQHVFASEQVKANSSLPDPQTKGPRINLIEAVKRTLETEMRINSGLLIFGEDVGLKGGAHGATAHMQSKFGAERVFDTSLSEEGIIGSAVGLSLAGLRPVPEIQFRKYTDPATEQINDTGTIRWRTAGKFSAPMVVRIPVGFSKVTGDPFHSVTGEAIFAHTLGWRLAFPSNAVDAAGLLRTALRSEDPVLFFEHRALLDTPQARRPWPGDEYMLPFGEASLLSEGEAVTVVTWGFMVHPVQEAAEGLDGIEILDLRTISPWDKNRVLESVKKTGKCLIVHEDTITGGFAGEIMATISSEAFEWLDAPLQRIATPDSPIPFNVELMNAILPNVDSIHQKMKWLLAY